MFAVLTSFAIGIPALSRDVAASASHLSAESALPGDAALLVRHRDGDGAAFTALVAAYRAPVYSYLYRCGVEAALRDDLFQEVFLKIHRSADSFRADQPLKPWIFTIVANTVRSHFRGARVREVVSFEADLEAGADPAPDAHELSEARETAAWLDRALQALPLAQREVLSLCCLEEMSQDEVAGALGLPINTVKTHLRRARLSLAQALARRNAKLQREVPS